MKTGRDHIVFWFLYVIPMITVLVLSLLHPVMRWLKEILPR